MAKLHVERVGGFAGFGGGSHIRSHGEVETATLAADQQRAVEALFRARGKAQPSPVRDGFRYRLSRATPQGIETIEAREADVPAVISECVKDELV